MSTTKAQPVQQRKAKRMRRFKLLFLDRESQVPLQVQLTAQIKDLIRAGQLAAGDRLPSTRELAVDLNVSRNTVVYTYDRLVSEGYLHSRERSSIYVAETAPELQRAARERSGVRQALHVPETIPIAAGSTAPVPFRPCQPDVHLFPLAMWNRLRSKALRTTQRSLLHYNSAATLGLRELRENLAAYLRESRGVRCEWWQVAITSGSQQALFLLAQLLLQRGDRVSMEDPGYQGAVRAWRAAGAEISYLPIDAEGVRIPDHEERVSKLVYVTPSRQFPTGVSLSLGRRLALVNGAADKGIWIVEDDYDSEFRYDAAPLPSLQSLDVSGRIIYIGTFSKLLFPALRLGYAVLPVPLVEKFQELKSVVDDHGPIIDQATLAAFLDTGAFYSHIRRCRRAYAERQRTFLEAVQKGGLPFDFRYTDGGMNLTGFLPEEYDDLEASARLRRAGLDVPALSAYSARWADPRNAPIDRLAVHEHGLVFGFTAFTAERIRAGIETLLRTGLR
jgi:GntR family transcriptional regulator/MocR family aminotransferase